MANELTKWESQMKEMAVASAASESTGTSNIISLRGGVMTYMGEVVDGNELDCIVLGASGEHTYYEGAFDPDRIVPPNCFSVFALGEKPAPHESVPDPQNEDCGSCWAHQFKSADNGRGRACSVRRRLALIPAGAIENEETLEDSEVAIMKVPPTSVTNWGKYVNALAAKYQRPPFMVITKIKVIPNAKYQFTLSFEPVELVGPDMFEPLVGMSEGVGSMLMAPFDMSMPDDEEEEEVALKTDRKPAAKKTTKKKTNRRR